MTRKRDDYPHPINEGQTHYEGCWQTRGHHNCAVAVVTDLEARLEHALERVTELVAEDERASGYCARGVAAEAERDKWERRWLVASDAADLAQRRHSAAEQQLEQARGLLGVPIRKMQYLVRDYPDDKESKAWLELARTFLAAHPGTGPSPERIRASLHTGRRERDGASGVHHYCSMCEPEDPA